MRFLTLFPVANLRRPLSNQREKMAKRKGSKKGTKVVTTVVTKSKKSKSARKRAARKSVTAMVERKTEVRPMVVARNVSRPAMKFSGGQDFRNKIHIVGQEVVSEITTTAAFTQQIFQVINPLNPAVFPELSAIAAMYEEFSFESLVFKYEQHSPTVRSGDVAIFVETDVNDSNTPASMIELLNNRYAAVSSVYQDCSLTYPNKGVVKRYYTQANASGSEPEGDRTSFPGRVMVYTHNAASADSGANSGYFVVKYSVTFYTFRPPTASGFELVNNTDVPLVSGTPSNLQYTRDNGTSGSWSLGAWASRYTPGANLPLISGGITDKANYFLMPPVGKQTAFRSDVYVNAATSSRGDTPRLGVVDVKRKGSKIVVEEPEEDKKVEARIRTEASFLPYETVQLEPGGPWYYSEYPDGPLYPIPSAESLEKKSKPLTTGDITFIIYSTDYTGTITPLYTLSVTDTAARLMQILGRISPAGATFIYGAITAVFATARLVDYYYNLIGPATRSSGGDDLRRRVARGIGMIPSGVDTGGRSSVR